jgi:photosystem II stability/assembly factor-like uncharacterized protein
MKILLMVIFLVAVQSGGGEWKRLSVPTDTSFRGIDALNENRIYMSGTNGTVLRTVDGGKTWSSIQVPGAEQLDFRGIVAFAGGLQAPTYLMSSGPASEGKARIYRSTDEGKHWSLIFEEKTPGIFFDAIAFWDDHHGIVLSDPVDGHFVLFQTADAGRTWTRIPDTALPPSLPNEGAFAASNSCLRIVGKNIWFATGGAKVARVFHSGDRGKTWHVSETPMHPGTASAGIFALSFRDAKHGVAVGGDYALPNGSELPNILLTNDGGKTWAAAKPTNPAGLYLSSVIYSGPLGERTPISVAGTAGILRSDDSGNWRIESTESINALLISKELDLWAVGPKGTVLLNASRR